LIVVVTSATSHWAWVQIELNALKSPLVGWVTTYCAGSSKITPPPTGTLETATLGPFSSGGPVTWTAVASDKAGNASDGRTGTITVSDCGVIP